MTNKEKYMEELIEGWDKLSEDTKRDIWGNLNHQTVTEAIKEELKEFGVGENNFMFTEIGIEENLEQKCETVYDYDYRDWIFQQKCIKEQGGTPEQKHQISLRGDWVRMIQDNSVKMGCIISLSNYIYDQVEEQIIDDTYNLIPSDITFVKTEGSKYLTLEENTHGRDKEKDELRKKTRTLREDIQKQINEYVDKNDKQGTYIKITEGSRDDDFITYIFTDIESMKKTTIKNFMRDFEYQRRDITELDEFMDSLKKKITAEVSTWLIIKGASI